MKAIIIDDEERSRSTLQRILKKYCPQVKVLGQAENADDAFKLIKELGPDVIFLDIEMPNGSGFDLLKRFETVNFEVIFTTGFDQYGLQAIKVSALDYILKPLDVEEIIAAVKKVEARQHKDKLPEQLALMMAQLQQPKSVQDKIALPTNYGLVFVTVGKVIRLEAQENYTRIFLEGEKPVLCTRTLREFEGMLAQYPFIRCHRKHLINGRHLKKYYKGEGGYVEMMDGSTVDVSRRRKDAFLKELNRL